MMIRCAVLAAVLVVGMCHSRTAVAEFQVGAAVVDVTPEQFPVFVNGGMLTRSADQVNTPINARVIVLDDGRERIGIAVVDSCMMPRPFLDDVKHLTAMRTQLRPDRTLISATHTHSAPSCMGALGTEADPNYVTFLREKLVESFVAAEANLEPARVGWGVGDAGEFTALRRWIRRPDRLAEDPLGNLTVRANMHAARNWDDVTGESGPEDPALSLISFQSLDGRPIAVLANFSMHYFGDTALSADYFGLFCEGLKAHLAAESGSAETPFVGLLSHGCSGDIWRRDYRQPEGERGENVSIQEYTDGLLKVALETYDAIEYRDDADLAMAESRFELQYRMPDQQRLEWAQKIVDAMGDRPPKDRTEVYAREQVILHDRQSTEVVVQALRIGEIAIATTPNETYALTGLKLKLQSPLEQTMVIELANGGDGYIPPPEQHHLGGYNTWAARSAGLEVQAEPKIAEAALQLLEEVSAAPRRDYQQPRGALCRAVLNAEPLAYWRLDEFAPPVAVDASAQRRNGFYEPGVVFFLEGPQSDGFTGSRELNRAAHFAGGRMRTRQIDLGETYSVSLWIWNGMPVSGRGTTGWMFSRGHEHARGAVGDHLGLGGTDQQPGRMIFDDGTRPQPWAGRTEVARWTWNHVVFVRDQDRVRVHLNGEAEPEIECRSSTGVARIPELFFGGRCDNLANWEGRLDEIALFDRVLSTAEIESFSGQ